MTGVILSGRHRPFIIFWRFPRTPWTGHHIVSYELRYAFYELSHRFEMVKSAVEFRILYVERGMNPATVGSSQTG